MAQSGEESRKRIVLFISRNSHQSIEKRISLMLVENRQRASRGIRWQHHRNSMQQRDLLASLNLRLQVAILLPILGN
jgi:hypothetical protein